MAIAPISHASSASSLAQLLGRSRVSALGRADSVPPVEAIFPPPGRREEVDPLDRNGEDAASPFQASAAIPSLDKRSASSLVELAGNREKGFLVAGEGRAGEAGSGKPENGGALDDPRGAEATKDRDSIDKPQGPSESDIRGRLAELEGEKARKDRERTGEASQRGVEEASMVAKLKARDGEVRAHESAHIAAGGRYITGGASFTYQKGPDGAQYAIGGEVGIDSSPVPGKPEETIAKMRIVRAAALAPAEPSGADLAVAGAAAQAEAQAVASLAEESGRNSVAPAVDNSREQTKLASYIRSNDELPGARIDLVA